jgi:hypothetical protein
MRRREVWVVFLLALVAALVISYVVEFLQHPVKPVGPKPEEQDLTLDPMPLPRLEALDLPAPLEVDERTRATIALLLEQPELVANNLFGPTSTAFAWFDAQLPRDRSERPLHQRFSGEDLARGRLGFGTVFNCDATLLELQTIAGREWGLVALGPEWYGVFRAEQIVEAVVIGNDVRLIGRLMGTLPYADGSALPVFACDVVQPTPPETPLATAVALPMIGLDGSLPPEDDVYDEIDDVHPSLELRPYYYLLGVVSRNDRYQTDPYEGALSAVGESIAIHQDPQPYRGRPMTFEGYVLYSFEDHQVERDQPFGIERVLHIVCWNTMWGPYSTRNIEGQVQTKMAWVRQAFELAIIGDQPPPPRGAFIRATGRFLKVHGVPAKANRQMDELNEVTRHSDNVYFKFIVCNDYADVTPGAIDWGPLRLAFLILVPLCVLWVAWLQICDNRQQAARPEKVRRLRNTRRKLGLDRVAGLAGPESGTLAEAVPCDTDEPGQEP